MLELKAAIAGIVLEFERGLRRVPIQAQPTLITEGRMLLGTDIRAVRATLDALPIDVIGLNCSTGPAQMRDSIRFLCENSRCFVSVVPNAGLPLMGPQGETIYPESPEELAAELGAFVRDFGVDAVGGCCGTTPAHITALRDAVASRGAAREAARRAPARSRLCDYRHLPRTRAASASGRRTHQRAGLAQSKASAAGGELRRHRVACAPASRGRRSRARRLLCADRKSRRGRADARRSCDGSRNRSKRRW